MFVGLFLQAVPKTATVKPEKVKPPVSKHHSKPRPRSARKPRRKPPVDTDNNDVEEENPPSDDQEVRGSVVTTTPPPNQSTPPPTEKLSAQPTAQPITLDDIRGLLKQEIENIRPKTVQQQQPQPVTSLKPPNEPEAQTQSAETKALLAEMEKMRAQLAQVQEMAEKTSQC